MEPFPNCTSCTCAKEACADHFPAGTKVKWPELLGVKGKEAVQVIKKENELVTPWLIAKHDIFLHYVCCDRVFVIVDSENRDPEALVCAIPRVG
ncbi:trypsin/subtilisin inhibitor-like [Macadamia integrifolia]|uniref:trypsin/subtilisin inhibitor-like n=1 Tax=Macadamia integrifolia TaxID=60698 RepID=UPI001C4F25FC|nr:trypsin/subtilisin inhibitor-like [Macadamia integrifolia]